MNGKLSMRRFGKKAIFYQEVREIMCGQGEKINAIWPIAP